MRQALCHHAENLQQRNRSEDALPLLEKAMKEAAKAGGASGAEAVAAQAQYALALFEVERATEAHVHHAQAAQGYDALTKTSHLRKEDAEYMKSIANSLHLISHFVKPKLAKPRRRASFEPENWELGAALAAMQKEAAAEDKGSSKKGTVVAFDVSDDEGYSEEEEEEEEGDGDGEEESDAGSVMSLSGVADDHLAQLAQQPFLGAAAVVRA